MVEVLIALAIFMILMIPLVNALITGMKTTTKAKETQYRNEFASELMESVIEVPLSVLNNKDKTFFEAMGATSVNPSGKVTVGDKDTYTVSGQTKLGTEHTIYSFLVEMTNEKYVNAGATGKYDSNTYKTGLVEDLDEDKVAVISADVANYDGPAHDALETMKISRDRQVYEAAHPVYDPNDPYDPQAYMQSYVNDTGRRIIKVRVDKNVTLGGYDITCDVDYFDSSGVGPVSYTPYTKHFDELTNIYVMYNVSVYNKMYTTDYLTFDLSGVDSDDKVNAFVIQTAENYSDNLTTTNAQMGSNMIPDHGTTLYHGTSSSRGTCHLNFAVRGGDVDKINIYHNMLDGTTYSGAPTYGDATNNALVGFYGASSSYATPSKVEYLDKALEDFRGIYDITVYMKRGIVDDATLKDSGAVLRGTRGGSEID